MSDDDSKNKDDSFESSSDSDDPSFGPAALGLHRVGTEPPKRKKTTPLQKLNARGVNIENLINNFGSCSINVIKF